MDRVPEPEYMDDAAEADAYATADFSEVNAAFVLRVGALARHKLHPLALDIGTGPGDIPALISAAHPDWRITGIDASHAMLCFAALHRMSSLSGTGLSWVQTDAKAIPFADASFDVVFSNSILHHVTDTERFWQEVKRVVKSDAVIILRDLCRPESEMRAREIVNLYAGTESALLQEEFYRSLLAAYTVKEVRKQLDFAGLSMLKTVSVTDRHLDVFGGINPE